MEGQSNSGNQPKEAQQLNPQSSGAHFESGVKINNLGSVVSRFKMWIRRERDPRHQNIKLEKSIAPKANVLSESPISPAQVEPVTPISSEQHLPETHLPIHQTTQLAQERLAQLREQKIAEYGEYGAPTQTISAQVENVKTDAETDTIHKSEHPQEIRDDTLHVQQSSTVQVESQPQIVAEHKGGALAMPNERDVVSEEEGSPIHPDIEAGARVQIEQKLVDAVRDGSPAGIRIAIHNYGRAFEQGARAAHSQFELTPEGQKVLPERLKAILERHILEGIQNIVEMSIYRAGAGRTDAFEDAQNRLMEFLKIASDYDIGFSFTPQSTQPDEETLLPIGTLTSVDQIIDYTQEKMVEALPKGLAEIIDNFRYRVSSGRLNPALIEDFNQKIEKWLEVMQKHGWEVVDHPTPYPVQGDRAPETVVREVNKAEIRQLQEQLIKDNLAKGVADIMRHLEWKIKNGRFDPLDTLIGIQTYVDMAQKYGLTQSGGLTARDSTINPEDYFDPSQIPQQVTQIVKDNLPLGLESLVESHLRSIQRGFGGLARLDERTVGEYGKLASQYGVSMNEAELRDRMSQHITPEFLQMGISERLRELRDAVQAGNYLSVSACAIKAEEFEHFINEVGMSEQVDLSPLRQYMQETATDKPRLTQ